MTCGPVVARPARAHLPTVYLLSTYCLPAARGGAGLQAHELALRLPCLLCTCSVLTLYLLWRRRGVLVQSAGAECWCRVLVQSAGAACWPEPLGGYSTSYMDMDMDMDMDMAICTHMYI